MDSCELPQCSCNVAILIASTSIHTGSCSVHMIFLYFTSLAQSLFVCKQVLREQAQCKLPVEVAYRGPADMDDHTLASLEAQFSPLHTLDLNAVPYLAHEMK